MYLASDATLATLSDSIRASVEQIHANVDKEKIRPLGQPIFIFKNLTQDPSKPFQLEVGLPVRPDTKEVGDLKVRDLEPIHAASVIYSGPSLQVAQAYEQLYGDLLSAGMTPTSESRQITLYFESEDSPNNVDLVMVGVQ